MHYCSKDCLIGGGGGNDLQTFESRDGLYGHSDVGGSYPLSGTGQCKICGGGGAYKNPTGVPGEGSVKIEDDDVVYDPYVTPLHVPPAVWVVPTNLIDVRRLHSATWYHSWCPSSIPDALV